MIRIKGLTESDLADPIVWEHFAQRLEGSELAFRHVVMRQSDFDRLSKAFGDEWIERHKTEIVTELKAWEQERVH